MEDLSSNVSIFKSEEEISQLIEALLDSVELRAFLPKKEDFRNMYLKLFNGKPEKTFALSINNQPNKNKYEELSKKRSSSRTWQASGIDLPIVIYPESQKGNKRVMIIGQDPRRNKREVRNTKKVFIGSPWGFHSIKIRERGSLFLVYEIFKFILNEKATLYLTDVIKTCGGINGIQKFRHADSSNYKLLQKEVDMFNPTHIITLGKHACESLMHLNTPEIQIITCVHPGSQNTHYKNKKENIMEKLRLYL